MKTLRRKVEFAATCEERVMVVELCVFCVEVSVIDMLFL